MTILAQTLAAKYDLDFAEAFSQQYVIRKGKDRFVDGMTCFNVRDWSFCVGRQLHCFTVTVPTYQTELVFIGVAVDPEGELVTQELLTLGLCQGLIDPAPERRFGFTDTIAAVPKGGLVLRGQIINISKGYHFTGKYIAEFLQTYGTEHRPWVGMHALALRWSDNAGKRWMREKYLDWADSLPEGAKPRVVDFALVEQHRTHSMGRFLNLFSRNFYMAPACDRACIKAMISIPPHLRYHLYIHDMIFQQAAPELLDLPYHKLFTPYFDKFRHSDTLEEQLSRLPDRV